MRKLTIRLYGDLLHFLPSKKRRRQFIHAVKGGPSIKDVLESLGIPHTEIQAIVINRKPVQFRHNVKEGERVEVYPEYKKCRAKRVQNLQPPWPRKLRFVLDVHLGTLARRLRLLGFDALYDQSYSDQRIILISGRERRVILTRDTGLLKNSLVCYGYFVRATDPNKQIKELIKKFSLKNQLKIFSRCLECNGIIRVIPKAKVQEKLPPRTVQYYKRFYSCRSCGRIYWEGSHFKHLKKIITSIKSDG